MKRITSIVASQLIAIFFFASVALPVRPTEEVVPTIPLPETGIEFQITAEQEYALEELNFKNKNKFQVKWPETKRNNFYLINSMPDVELGEEKKVGKKFLKNISPVFKFKPQLEDLYLEKVVRVDPPNVEKIAKEKFGKTLGELLHTVLKGNRGDNILRFIKKYLGLSLGDIIRELHKGKTHLFFQQTHNSIPIYGAKVHVHIPDGKKPSYVNGTYYPNVEVSNEVSILEDEAIKIAKESLNINTEEKIVIEGEIIANLIILPVEGDFYYVYEVLFSTIEPFGDWEIIVNAQYGEIHGLRNLVLSLDTVTRTGSVYVHHPLISDVTSEPLPNLYDTGFLEGLYARVFNNDVDGAYEPSYEFDYNPLDTHFDEVNVYYHVDKVHSYFKNRTGLTTMDWDINAVVHVGDCWDGASYSPFFNGLFFGDGSRRAGCIPGPRPLNDLAQEEAIIYHEYTHAMNSSIIGMPAMSMAMNEGIADYYASSFTNDPVIGEYVAQNRPLSPTGGLPRSVNNTNSFSETFLDECHGDGMIYSGALWDYRYELDKDRIPVQLADSIILNGIFNITPSLPGAGRCRGVSIPDLRNMFRDGLNGLVVASNNSQYPWHTNMLLNSFAYHGIFQDDLVAIVSSLNTKVSRDVLFPLTFYIWTGDAETNFNTHYYVQLTTNSSLFLESNAGQRNSANFYESSIRAETDDGYVHYVIERLVFNNFTDANPKSFPIFYRVVTFTDGPPPTPDLTLRVSTPESEYESAPFMTVGPAEDTGQYPGCKCSHTYPSYSYTITELLSAALSSALLFIIPALFIFCLKFSLRRDLF